MFPTGFAGVAMKWAAFTLVVLSVLGFIRHDGVLAERAVWEAAGSRKNVALGATNAAQVVVITKNEDERAVNVEKVIEYVTKDVPGPVVTVTKVIHAAADCTAADVARLANTPTKLRAALDAIK